MADITQRIRNAYDDLATRPGGCIRLTELRVRLDYVPRGLLDTMLLAMDRSRMIQLEPDPDRVALTAGDRESAIPLGGQDMHLLRFILR